MIMRRKFTCIFLLHFLFFGISGSFLRRLSPASHGSELVRSSADVDVCDTSVCILEGPESVGGGGRFSLNASSDDGPVRRPSPSSSSSVTLLLLLMFANVTFVQTCGRRDALTMCTRISSKSVGSLFEGEGLCATSQSISVTNLQL